MLRNYIKIAVRNITRHKVYTIINVLGLSLGISACVIIYLITRYDLSFDNFHPDKERIFRVVGEMKRGSDEPQFLNSPYNDLAGLQTQIPGYEKNAGFHTYREKVTVPQTNGEPKQFDGRITREGSWSASTIITGPSYFDIFRYQWLAGNPATSLKDPFKVVLSLKRAEQYFGNIPVDKMIGKAVIYEDSLHVTVSGIVNDWTGNTDFGYTDFISVSTATHSFLKNNIPTEDWSSLNPHRSMAFVKLEKGVSAEQINKRFADYIKNHVDLHNSGAKLTMVLQPLGDIHFTKDFHRGDDGDDFDKPYLPTLYTLMGVALFILIIAVFNFINLSTAQSLQRAKEIGVRKVLGSGRTKIIVQFLTETTVLTLLAMALSLALVNPILKVFSGYIPEGIQFHPFESSSILFIIAIAVITALLAGFYPAVVLSSYLPVLSLKGTITEHGTNKINIRKALMVFQFTISLIFIIGALVIGKQISFMSEADKGFNTDAVVTVQNWDDHEGKLKIFAQNIQHLPGVVTTIMQGTSPMGFAQNIDNFKFGNKRTEKDNLRVLADMGDSHFIPFYKIKLIAGRNMIQSDSLNEFVINSTFSKVLGFKNPDDAIGQLLYHQSPEGEKAFPIVGVVADYHTGSFHEAIQPVVIENVPDRKFSVAIKLAGNQQDIKNLKEILAPVEAEWKKLFPQINFNYSFLNESIQRLFDQEIRTAKLINIAMGLTIFISCIGLFGLGMFTAQRRTKEIGIRKVLGASVSNIAAMLSKDFVVLVLIALVIASPIAWYFMNEWLHDFVYRTNIGAPIFIIAGLCAIIIALATVSFQAIRAAIANPVKSLRTE